MYNMYLRNYKVMRYVKNLINTFSTKMWLYFFLFNSNFSSGILFGIHTYLHYITNAIYIKSLKTTVLNEIEN